MANRDLIGYNIRKKPSKIGPHPLSTRSLQAVFVDELRSDVDGPLSGSDRPTPWLPSQKIRQT
jgi:hypothetical protein